MWGEGYLGVAEKGWDKVADLVGLFVSVFLEEEIDEIIGWWLHFLCKYSTIYIFVKE